MCLFSIFFCSLEKYLRSGDVKSAPKLVKYMCDARCLRGALFRKGWKSTLVVSGKTLVRELVCADLRSKTFAIRAANE